MTAHRDLKRIIRERQKKTRESYTAARAHVLRARGALLGLDADPPATTGPLRVDAVVLKVNEAIRIACYPCASPSSKTPRSATARANWA